MDTQPKAQRLIEKLPLGVKAANEDVCLGVIDGVSQSTSREKYDASLGCMSGVRYITSDPIGIFGGVNTYLYALANPILFVELDGLMPFPVMPGAGGAAIYQEFQETTQGIKDYVRCVTSCISKVAAGEAGTQAAEKAASNAAKKAGEKAKTKLSQMCVQFAKKFIPVIGQASTAKSAADAASCFTTCNQ